MSLSIAEKKRFRRIGHELSPVILTGGSGVTEGVLAGTDRALEDHELIKVRVNGEGREGGAPAIQKIAAPTKSQIVQSIGKVVLLYRPARKPNANLSNLLRYNHLHN